MYTFVTHLLEWFCFFVLAFVITMLLVMSDVSIMLCIGTVIVLLITLIVHFTLHTKAIKSNKQMTK